MILLFGALVAALGAGLLLLWRQRNHCYARRVEAVLAEKNRELQEAIQQLEQSRGMLQLVIESIPVRVFWKDKDLRYLGCNSLFANDAGFSHPHELLGKDDFAMAWQEQASKYRADDRRVIESGRPQMDIVEPQTISTGVTSWLNTSKVPLQKPDGEVFGVLGVYEDITERRQASKLVQAQRDLARVIGSVSSMQAALPRCLEIALRLSDMDCGGIYLFDPDRRVLELVYHQGLGRAFVQAEACYPADAPNVQIVMRGTASYFSAAETSQLEILHDERLCTIGVIPIQYQGRALGCINVASHSLPEVRESTRQLLETIAAEIGNVIMYLQAEEALRSSKQLLYESQAIANLGSWTADIRTGTFDATPEGASLIGWLPGIHTMDDLLAVIHPDDQEYMRSCWAAAMRGVPYDIEHRINLNGEVRWLHVKARLMFDEDGCPISALGISQDITERKQIERTLRQWADAFEHCAYGIAINLPHSEKILTCNPAFALLQGRTIAEVAALPILSMYASEDREHVNTCIAEADRSGKVRYEAQMIRSDGGIYPVQMDLVSVRDEQGNLLYRVATQQDITERKQAEETLRQSEIRFRALIENAPGAITLLDANGRLVFISSSTQRVMGYRPEEALGIDPAELTHPADLPALLVMLENLLHNPGKVCTAQYRFRHQDGSWRWVESVISNLLHEPSVNALAFNFQDITERKQAEIALRLSEEQYRGLMESLDSLIITVDAAGHILYINQVAARQSGSAADALIGKLIAELFPEPAAAEQMDNIRRVIEEDRARIYEAPRLVQGRRRWYRTSIQPIHDELGRVASALINSTDIHDLKTTQQELLELNRTLEERVQQRTAEVQDLYENAPVGYHSLDTNATLIMINQTQLSWMGYSRAELIGRPLAAFLAPASLAPFQFHFAAFKARGWVRDLELELLHKSGSTIPVLISATAIYDKHGNYLLSRSTVFDNTERKKAEIALRESEEQNRLLFEESPDAVVLFDEHSAMVQMNRAFEQLTGFTAQRLAGHRLEAIGLVSHDQVEQLEAAVSHNLQAQPGFATAELRLKRADGELRNIGARVYVLNLRGRRHYLTTMRDITTEKKVEETLRLANAELARAARAKDEFLANMSHELRTPLNAILALSESLLEQIRGPLNARQQESLRNIETSGRHLLALINDILDLSKVEAGRLNLQIETVSIGDVCRASMLFVREMAAKKSLKLMFELSDPLAEMDVDPKRLKQMLVNLLSNAVKFTPPPGRVSLEVSVDAEAGVVRFAVRDTGIGIAPDDIALLFQPFRQLDSSLSRQHEGSGLGLVLVRRLVELHGGSVTVESVAKQGSCFTIALPHRRGLAASAGGEKPGPARLKSMDSALDSAPLGDSLSSALMPRARSARVRTRILLAEDNAINILALSDFLGARGYSISIAHNGQEALDQAGAEHPDLILMDVQMPEIDGLEVIRRLRARSEFAATPIIALTALVMPGDRERCLEAGASEYLTKPVSLKELAQVMQQLLSL